MVCQKNAWPKDCQHTHTRQLMCTWGMNSRKHRASAVKAVHGLLQSDVLQVKDADSAKDEKEFTNYKITTSSLLACERDSNKVLGKQNGELEIRLATAADTIRELEKNQAALKSQLAIKVSTDLFCP